MINHHFNNIQLVTEINSDTLYGGIAQMCEFQEVEIIGAIVETGYQNDIMTVKRPKIPHEQMLDLCTESG